MNQDEDRAGAWAGDVVVDSVNDEGTGGVSAAGI